jgi:hypothetical protein
MKTCSVVILSEDEIQRDRAQKFCNALTDRFWTQCEFDIAWFTFADLADMKKSAASAHGAGATDVVVVACAPGEKMPTDIHLWVEQWISHRCDREGSLVSLVDNTADCGSGREVYLRNVARRGGLDFLTWVPDTLLGALPENTDSVCERATRISGILEDILRKPIAPRTLPFPAGKI